MARAAATLDKPWLRLRPFSELDWPAYAEMSADIEMMQYIGPGNVRSIAVAEAIGESLHGRIELMGAEALVYEARR